jgi:FtsP/CotA-like multicopper oxidase with cupredoxin domain
MRFECVIHKPMHHQPAATTTTTSACVRCSSLTMQPSLLTPAADTRCDALGCYAIRAARYINELEVETLIHAHGLTPPQELDGVPYVDPRTTVCTQHRVASMPTLNLRLRLCFESLIFFTRP